MRLNWTNQVKLDLVDLNMGLSLENIKKKSTNSFKKLVKAKAYEYEFSLLMNKKQTHSKMSSLNYSKLECQEYLKLENMSAATAKRIFKWVELNVANY